MTIHVRPGVMVLDCFALVLNWIDVLNLFELGWSLNLTGQNI